MAAISSNTSNASLFANAHRILRKIETSTNKTDIGILRVTLQTLAARELLKKTADRTSAVLGQDTLYDILEDPV